MKDERLLESLLAFRSIFFVDLFIVFIVGFAGASTIEFGEWQPMD